MNIFSILIVLIVLLTMIFVLPYVLVTIALFYVAFIISTWLTKFVNKNSKEETTNYFASSEKVDIKLEQATHDSSRVVFE
jgi:hypothetical protein